MKTLFTFCFVMVQILALSAQDSLVNHTPFCWYKADKNIDSIGYWQDLSIHSRHAAPLQSQAMPGTGFLNYNPCYVIQGEDKGFEIHEEFSTMKTITVIVVCKTSDSTIENSIWSAQKDTSLKIRLTTHQMQTEAFNIVYAENNKSEPLINTLTTSWKQPEANAIVDTIWIGGNSGLEFNGKIAEFIVIDDYIGKEDLQKIQTYLSIKYGITLTGSDYVLSDGTIVWSNNFNTTYNSGITGIGKDTIPGLNQKQAFSQSVNDNLAISVNTFVESNLQNNTNLNQGDFLIWGNNAEEFTFAPYDSATSSSLLSRHWMIQATGNTIRSVPTCLKFRIPDAVIDYNKLRLIISTDGIGISSTQYTLMIPVDSIDIDSNIYFKNIYWDTDSSGRDLFTLILLDEQQYQSTLQGLNNNPVVGKTSDSALDHQNNINTQGIANENGNSKFQSAEGSESITSCIIYPNPSTEKFTIELLGEKKLIERIKIFNSISELVLDKYEINKSAYTIDNPVLRKGNYIIEVFSSEKVFRLKVCVQ